MSPWTCAQAQESLSADAEGVLTADHAAALGRHLRGCPACRELRGAFGDVLEMLRALPVPEPRTGLERRFADAALRTRGAGRAAGPAWLALPLAAGLVAAVAGATLSAAVGLPRFDRVAQESQLAREHIAEQVEQLAGELDSLQASARLAARFHLGRATDRLHEFRRWRQPGASVEAAPKHGALRALPGFRTPTGRHT